jgi:glycosyltransferase involved in cell wall biosynthesis
MRVAAWVPEPPGTSPGQRYRIEQWDRHLAAQGIEITYRPFLDASTARLLKTKGHSLRKAVRLTRLLGRRLVSAKPSSAVDVVYVFRETALLGPALAERLLRARGVPFVFDFDDAIWHRYVSPANAYWSYLRCPGKTATSCRLGAHVIAGNETLAAYAHRHAANVSIVPTTIDTELYVPALERGLGQPPVIGWTGSYSTVQYLRLVEPVLQRLNGKMRIRFVVVGAERMSIEGIKTEFRPWRAATETEDLRDFDIGIMPLLDAEWERGKCGAKALQYMALGIPTVASPVGVNTAIISHGENGFLAGSEAEWEACLERLLVDGGLRRRFAAAGRATVERLYSARAHAPRVAEILRAAGMRARS